METKHVYNCLGKFGCEGESQRWKGGTKEFFFNFVFEVEESLSTCKYLLEKFSQERKIDYCGKKKYNYE